MPRTPVTKRLPLILLPFWAPVRPRVAAASLVAAPPWAFQTVFVLGLVTYAAVIVFLMPWDATLEQRWVFPTPTSASVTSVPATGVQLQPPPPPAAFPTQELEERGFGEVWREWRATAVHAWLSRAEATLALVLGLGTLATFALGWLNLPLNHRSGSVFRSYKRSVRGASGIVWLLTPLTLAWWAVCRSKQPCSSSARRSW